VAALSDVGMRRRNNQDSLAFHLADGGSSWERSGHLFVVADGMGAHAAGELASRLAVDLVQYHYEKNQQPQPAENLHRAFIEANNEIYRRGQANIEFRNMGTTCSALVLVPEGAMCAHVGDSRVYRSRGSTLEQLTFDHSLVWEMQAAGGLGEQAVHDLAIPKNVITRSLGPNASVVVDLEGPLDLRVGDRFLLCSDGLSGQLTDLEIGVFLQHLSTDDAAQGMLDLANLRGGPDNISLIIVEIASPLIATNLEEDSIPDRSDRRTWALPIEYGIGAAMGILGSIILLLAGHWPVALGVLIVGLISLVVGFAAAPKKKETVLDERGHFGRGPYRRYDCHPDAILIDSLDGTIQALRDAANENNWVEAKNAIETALAEAESAKQNRRFPEAFSRYVQIIIQSMKQIRLARNT
jgi:PPM family protein phosphatase